MRVKVQPGAVLQNSAFKSPEGSICARHFEEATHGSPGSARFPSSTTECRRWAVVTSSSSSQTLKISTRGILRLQYRLNRRGVGLSKSWLPKLETCAKYSCAVNRIVETSTGIGKGQQ